MRIPFISAIAAATLALGGCAYGNMGYGGIGLGYGSSYGYGYDYGSPYYNGGYGAYGSPYYGAGYGSYGYGSPYFGWYDDFYYPGTGIYVYDSGRRRHVWNDNQRKYWSSRQRAVNISTPTANRNFRENWSGFNRRSTSGTYSGGHHRTH